MSAQLFDGAHGPLSGRLFIQARYVFVQKHRNVRELRDAGGKIELHDEGKQQAIAGAMRAVGGAADRIFQGVYHGHAHVGKCQPAQRGAKSHALACFKILAIGHGATQIFANQRDGLFGHDVAHRVLTLVDGALPLRQGKMSVINSRIAFNCMRECVDAAVSRHLGRAGDGQQRINKCNAQAQEITEDAYLHLVFRVRQHGGRGNLRARAGRGGHTEERQDRSRNLVIAHVGARACLHG